MLAPAIFNLNYQWCVHQGSLLAPPIFNLYYQWCPLGFCAGSHIFNFYYQLCPSEFYVFSHYLFCAGSHSLQPLLPVVSIRVLCLLPLSSTSITSGVHQGSVLAPPYFNLYYQWCPLGFCAGSHIFNFTSGVH